MTGPLLSRDRSEKTTVSVVSSAGDAETFVVRRDERMSVPERSYSESCWETKAERTASSQWSDWQRYSCGGIEKSFGLSIEREFGDSRDAVSGAQLEFPVGRCTVLFIFFSLPPSLTHNLIKSIRLIILRFAPVDSKGNRLIYLKISTRSGLMGSLFLSAAAKVVCSST
jgi:hypothetical protein